MHNTGLIIAVLGVDGSGKSTLIQTMKSALDKANHNATHVLHLRPGLLPPLARLKGKARIQEGPVLEPHGATPSGPVGSLVRLVYYTFDYILGYWLKIRPMIVTQPTIVIFDRYAYDMALDPRRFRIGLSGCVAGWFAALAPKPDLILCLYAPPEVIMARKQELPMDEIYRQVEALKAFAAQESRAVLISNSGSVDEVRTKVLEVIFDFLSRRWVGSPFASGGVIKQ